LSNRAAIIYHRERCGRMMGTPGAGVEAI